MMTRETSEAKLKNPFGSDCNMFIREVPEEDKAILSIIGAIELPGIYSDIFVLLEELSTKYPILEIQINSPGGAMITLDELISRIKRFEYVITIGRGEVCSAGFLLWMMGHTRVTSPYATYMSHRESSGNGGVKTNEALEMYRIIDTTYEKMYKDLLPDLNISDELKEKMKYTELWFTADELIEKELCISEDEYNKYPNQVSIDNIITIAGKSFKYEHMFQKWVEVKVEVVTYGEEKDKVNIVDKLTELLYEKVKDESKDTEKSENDEMEESEGNSEESKTVKNEKTESASDKIKELGTDALKSVKEIAREFLGK